MTQPFEIRQRWDQRLADQFLAATDPKQLAFAQAVALTRTGQAVKAGEQETIRSSFDRPTPYTQNSLFLQGASPRRLVAKVWFKDFAPKGTPAGVYLQPGVYGGQRGAKRFEKLLSYRGFLRGGHALVPASGAELDAYGNVKRGYYNRILSQLQAQFDPTANETARSRRRKGVQRGGRFFYGSPGGRGRGIWERFSFAFGSAVRPIFLEASALPEYHARFPFFERADAIARERFQPEFETAWAQARRTAR